MSPVKPIQEFTLMAETVVAPSQTPVRIRPATERDTSFIEELYERVETTGAPAWHLVGDDVVHSTHWLPAVLAGQAEDQVLLVAETPEGTRLGYTWVVTLTDFDMTSPHGHIANVGVAIGAEGQGVGSLLVQAGEDWCRSRGLTEVTLHVYMNNERAHRLYDRLGFQDQWYQMRKGLD
jgi:ribosomal protein S18 acetylase RimI-like enzyme